MADCSQATRSTFINNARESDYEPAEDARTHKRQMGFADIQEDAKGRDGSR